MTIDNILSSEARFGIKRKQIYIKRKLRKEIPERKYKRKMKKKSRNP